MADPTQITPLTLQDIPHLEEEPEAFNLMKTAINETIAEYALSFEDDVQDVFPCPDWMRLLSQDNAVDNCNIRITLTAKGCTVEVGLCHSFSKKEGNSEADEISVIAITLCFGRNAYSASPASLLFPP